MQIKLNDKDLFIVKEILHKYLPEYEVRAFGSRVNGNPKEFSDLDLAIITDKPIPFVTIAKLKNEFSESNLPFRVDVVDWTFIEDSFRKLITQKYFVIQTKS